ncbi:MAG TPA: hypothetical protein VD963_09635, partial [Phycisphaerales bacterium]|nr:hypothetical protein [Phycisphaerales bacterium]
MSTITPARPATPALPRAAAPSPGAAAAQFVPIDPVKLLRQYAPSLVAALAFGAVVGLAAHLVLMQYWPRYTSSVIFECRDPVTTIYTIDTGWHSRDEIQRFIGTQAQLMTTEKILLSAVENPEVKRSAWGRQFYSGNNYQPRTAVRELDKIVSARIIPETALIRLAVTYRNPGDAKVLVEAVRDAYETDLDSMTKQAHAERRELLSSQLGATRDRKRSLIDERMNLVGSSGMDSLDVALSNVANMMHNLNAQRVETQGDLDEAQSYLVRFERNAQTEATPVYPDAVREEASGAPVVRDMDRDIANLQAQVDSLTRRGFGENHPDVQAVRTLIETKRHERDGQYERVLRESMSALVDKMRTSMEASASKLKQIDAQLAEAYERKNQIVKNQVTLDQIEKELAELAKSERETENALRELEGLRDPKIGRRVRVVQMAATPDTPSFPKVYFMVPLGIVAVGGLFTAGIFLREVLDQRVRGPADITLIPRLRVLGVVPAVSEDPSRPASVATAFRDSPSGVITESFRQIRGVIAKRMDQAEHASLLVIAGMPGSGATTVVTNLAMGFAASERRVLIVDANFRRPGVHRVFGLRDGPGLADVLAGSATALDSVQGTSTTNLWVLAAGTPANRALPE